MAGWNLETTQTIRQDRAKLWLEWPEYAVAKPVQHAIQTDRTSQISTSEVILLEVLAGMLIQGGQGQVQPKLVP
jgi:hypothetical protein